MQYFRHEILAFFAILPILSYLHFWDFWVCNFLHEKMRHFIIVIEKYTKNDDNQNINGLTKGHEKTFLCTQLGSTYDESLHK